MIKTSFDITTLPKVGFPGGSDYKESASQRRRLRFDPWVPKHPQRRKWQWISDFLLENSKARAWQWAWQATVYGVTESDTTKWLTLSLSISPWVPDLNISTHLKLRVSLVDGAPSWLPAALSFPMYGCCSLHQEVKSYSFLLWIWAGLSGLPDQ